MKVTNVKLRLLEEYPLVAIARIHIDYELIVSELRVIENNGEAHVEFPKTAYQEKHHIQSVVTFSPEMQKEAEEKVLSAYRRALARKEAREKSAEVRADLRGESLADG